MENAFKPICEIITQNRADTIGPADSRLTDSKKKKKRSTRTQILRLGSETSRRFKTK